ncbi:unnamed protein product [Blepharisma stoltei]|uniref:Uncharacterized protein n=1 Tax=Blepharisma stoltei TaxID=1481888 RepID=A0AAU9K911_9CILI|nr:unnamed protein product [Blepharisma stoltei]
MTPTGILWLGGEINYNRYRINFALPPGISIEETINSLKQICNIKEIIMNNTIKMKASFTVLILYQKQNTQYMLNLIH